MVNNKLPHQSKKQGKIVLTNGDQSKVLTKEQKVTRSRSFLIDKHHDALTKCKKHSSDSCLLSRFVSEINGSYVGYCNEPKQENRPRSDDIQKLKLGSSNKGELSSVAKRNQDTHSDTTGKHEGKKTIPLTQDVYEQFRETLIQKQVPHFVHITYFDDDQKKIYIGIQQGYINVAREHIKKITPELYTENAFDIQEIGEVGLAGSKQKDFAVKSDVTAENAIFTSFLGQRLPKIQSGKTIHTWNTHVTDRIINKKDNFLQSANPNNLTGGKRATLGAIMRDINYGKLYGITAQHAFNTEEHFQTGDGDVYCTTFIKQGSEEDAKEEVNDCHISNKYLGVFGGCEIEGEQCVIDIAAFPIFEDLKIDEEVFPYFQNKKSEFIDMKVYRGDCNDLKGMPVQHCGMVSGLEMGTIIVPNADMYYKGNCLRRKFIVASDDGEFADFGDSGSFVVDDFSMCKDHRAHAYGVVFEVFKNFHQNDKVYKSVATCTRLDYGLDIMSEKGNCCLDFIGKPHQGVNGKPTTCDAAEDSSSNISNTTLNYEEFAPEPCLTDDERTDSEISVFVNYKDNSSLMKSNTLPKCNQLKVRKSSYDSSSENEVILNWRTNSDPAFNVLSAKSVSKHRARINSDPAGRVLGVISKKVDKQSREWILRRKFSKFINLFKPKQKQGNKNFNM